MDRIIARLLGTSVLLILCALSGCVRQAPPVIKAPPRDPPAAVLQPAPNRIDDMRNVLTYLASDKLEGRGLNTKGLDLAADLIADRFKQDGLKPLPGSNSYFLPFDLSIADAIDRSTALRCDGINFKLDEDFTAVSISAENQFSGPLAFVGYGITSKDHNYDDYANIDVKGKVVIALRFEPVDEHGKSRLSKEDWSSNSHLDVKAQQAAAHGAVAMILVNPPESHGRDALMLFTRQFRNVAAPIPYLQASDDAINLLLKRSNMSDLKTLQSRIDKEMKPQSQLMDKLTASGKVAFKRTAHHLKNVAGVLPASTRGADEYVVVGAHYDHLGRGGPGSLSPLSHEIHPGADDNASGTTAVLELAREMTAEAKSTSRPRSIIFVCFTAEETGLIGSNHMVNHPPVPIRKIAAMLNMDMVGRMRAHTLLVGGSGTAPSFDTLLAKAGEGQPIQIKDIGKGGLGPSDHMSFALKKVPVIFFFTGLHADYHRPTDTADKINFQGMAEVVDLAKRVVLAMTNMPHETYVDAADAFSMTQGQPGGSGTGGSRASLGVIPDYSEEPTGKGVKISGVSPKSAAAAAGLQGGDILTQFNQRKLDRLEDLSAALNDASPGDKVHLKFIRGDKTLEADATLGQRKY